MSEGLNRVMLMGNLGADPELRFGQDSEQAVLRLRLATTERYFDRRTNEWKDRTDWHSVVLFGPRAERLQKLLKKGSSLFVEGRLQTSSYEKEGQKIWRTDVIATNILLPGARPTEDGRVNTHQGGVVSERPNFQPRSNSGSKPMIDSSAPPDDFDPMEDEIPF